MASWWAALALMLAGSIFALTVGLRMEVSPGDPNDPLSNLRYAWKLGAIVSGMVGLLCFVAIVVGLLWQMSRR